MPESLRRFLGGIWLWTLVIFIVVYVFSIVVAVFGWPLILFFDAKTTLNYLYVLADIMLGLMVFSPLTGFAHDIQMSQGEA